MNLMASFPTDSILVAKVLFGKKMVHIFKIADLLDTNIWSVFGNLLAVTCNPIYDPCQLLL